MANVSNDVDEIRREMAMIRREMHQDVKAVVTTAHAATDWMQYLTVYPWLTLGAAFAVGYLIVPKRHHLTADALVATQADLKQVRKAVEATGRDVRAQTIEEPTPKGRSVMGVLFGMVAPLALKAVQGYALKYAEQWILQQQLATLHSGPASPVNPSHQPRPTPSGPQGHGGPGRSPGPRNPLGPEGL